MPDVPPSSPAEVQALAGLVAEARERISPHVVRTPCVPADELLPGLRLKLENEQHTGSFKLRGALNRILGLDTDQRAHGVLAASTGNHGAAVAFAAAQVGGQARIYAPTNAAGAKLATMRRAGAEVVLIGDECLASERAARESAASTGQVYVSPYNDLLVVAGQGTLGAELAEQVAGLETVYVAVGGGGLISGVGAWLRTHCPGVDVVGCSPVASAAMVAACAAGYEVEVHHRPTLSDGTAGGLEAGSITLPLCRAVVDRWVCVDEDAIAEAMRAVDRSHGLRIEGAAGVALAVALAERPSGPSAVVICGGNLDPAIANSVFG